MKLVRISHCSDSAENAIDCEITCHCVKRANVVLGLRKEIFASFALPISSPFPLSFDSLSKGVMIS